VKCSISKGGGDKKQIKPETKRDEANSPEPETSKGGIRILAGPRRKTSRITRETPRMKRGQNDGSAYGREKTMDHANGTLFQKRCKQRAGSLG